jgi:hypothetical protein
VIETSTIAELTRSRARAEATTETWNSVDTKPKTFQLVKLRTAQGPHVTGWWTGGSWDGAWGNKHFTIVGWAPYEERNYP